MEEEESVPGLVACPANQSLCDHVSIAKTSGTSLVVNPGGLTALAPGIKKKMLRPLKVGFKECTGQPVLAPPATPILAMYEVLDFQGRQERHLPSTVGGLMGKGLPVRGQVPNLMGFPAL